MPYTQILNPATGKPFKEVKPWDHAIQLRTEILRHLRARYDAAQDTHQNQNHWKWADSLSPNAANTLAIRKKLRERSRYEVANNGYLKGILLTLAADFTGSGPTLQITDRRFNPEQQQVIELGFQVYAKKIKLRRKLWRKRHAKCQDGESFAFRVRNPNLGRVIYDYRVLECDQVSSLIPFTPKNKRQFEIDGIRFDKSSGQPSQYHLLDAHPGEIDIWSAQAYQGQWIDARHVIHWFRQDRDWQRGIPETTSTLPLWALLRRYTLAVVQNAEIAADFTVLLESLQAPNILPFAQDSSGQFTEQDPNDWFSSFPIDRGLMTVLPQMYQMKQLDPKQPVTMYDTFVNALIQEASRPLLTPRNLALGNSGGYNMASGTLDRQFYRQAVNQERLDCNEEVLDRCLSEWWFEATRISDYWDDVVTTTPLYETIARFRSLRDSPPEHTWRWDEVSEHSDPVKNAMAIDILHKGGHLSDTDIQESRMNRSVEAHYSNLEKQYEWRSANPNPELEPAVDSNFRDDGEE